MSRKGQGLASKRKRERKERNYTKLSKMLMAFSRKVLGFICVRKRERKKRRVAQNRTRY